MINTIVCTRINQRDLPLIGSETGDWYLLYRYLSLLFSVGYPNFYHVQAVGSPLVLSVVA